MFVHLSVILFTGGSLSEGGVSAQGGISVQGVSVQEGLCQGWSLSRVVSVRETTRTLKCGRYASYWNAFL